MEPGRVIKLNGRWIWVCKLAFHLCVACLDRRMKRALRTRFRSNPTLRQAADPPTVEETLDALTGTAREIATRYGEAHILQFDSRRHFASLNPDTAIDLFAYATGATAQARTLRTIYDTIRDHSGGMGIQQGLSTSPLLAELATQELDELLRPAGTLVRYVDNFALFVPDTFYHAKRSVEEAFEEYASRTRSDVEPHEFEHVRYTNERGFERFRYSYTDARVGLVGVDFLGLHLRGHERFVSKTALDRHARERRKRGRRYAQQVLRSRRKLLTPRGYRHLQSVLRRAGGRGQR